MNMGMSATAVIVPGLGFDVDLPTITMIGLSLLAGLLLGLSVADWRGRKKRRHDREVMVARLRQMLDWQSASAASNFSADSLRPLIESAIEYVRLRELKDRTGANIVDDTLVRMPAQHGK